MLSSRIFFNLSVLYRRGLVRNVAVNASVKSVDEAEGKSWREIPGPSSLPFIGEFSDLETLQEKLYERYGPIVRLDASLGKPPIILLYDTEGCETILRNENNNLPIRPGFDSLEYYRKYYNKPKNEPLKPTGLITDHGENWKQFRTQVNPVMLQPKTIKLYGEALNEVADDMLKRIRSKRRDDGTVDCDFAVEMNLWALESVAVVALGGRLGCLNSDLPEDSPARKLIRNVHVFFTISNELDFKPSLWRYITTPKFKKAMKIYEEQETLSKYFIRKAMDDLKTKPSSNGEKGVLEKLLDIDELTAIRMANDMLFAGVDTTSTTMLTTLYLLATNPEKQDKLREELISNSNQMTYLKACLKESIRLYPVVSGNLRQTTKEYNILGYKIPKDISVVFCHQYLSVMEENFKRAKEYIPERWFNKEADYYYKNANPFAYNPFGFGVRACIGRRIAELEMETFLAKMIKNYKVSWFGPPIKVKPTSLNYTLGPYNFKLHDV